MRLTFGTNTSLTVKTALSLSQEKTIDELLHQLYLNNPLDEYTSVNITDIIKGIKPDSLKPINDTVHFTTNHETLLEVTKMIPVKLYSDYRSDDTYDIKLDGKLYNISVDDYNKMIAEDTSIIPITKDNKPEDMKCLFYNFNIIYTRVYNLIIIGFKYEDVKNINIDNDMFYYLHIEVPYSLMFNLLDSIENKHFYSYKLNRDLLWVTADFFDDILNRSLTDIKDDSVRNFVWKIRNEFKGIDLTNSYNVIKLYSFIRYNLVNLRDTQTLTHVLEEFTSLNYLDEKVVTDMVKLKIAIDINTVKINTNSGYSLIDNILENIKDEITS